MVKQSPREKGETRARILSFLVVLLMVALMVPDRYQLGVALLAYLLLIAPMFLHQGSAPRARTPREQARAYAEEGTMARLRALTDGWRLIVELNGNVVTWIEERIETEGGTKDAAGTTRYNVLTREKAEARWGPDPSAWPAWTCLCGQRNSGWVSQCGRCHRERLDDIS